jgi:hypothetical protein
MKSIENEENALKQERLNSSVSGYISKVFGQDFIDRQKLGSLIKDEDRMRI